LWLTGVAILASTVWNPLSNLLVAVNRHERFTIMLAAGVAITVPLTYAGTRLQGLNGAAAATLCLDLLLLGFAVQQARKAFGPLRFGAGSIAALARSQRGGTHGGQSE
jgi:O-antigen/teichoic acid export membrane protein